MEIKQAVFQNTKFQTLKQPHAAPCAGVHACGWPRFFVVEKVANVHFFGQILKISAQICIFCVSVFKDKVKLPRPFTFFTFATYHIKN
jgi:hypothetical protein